jgi:hypothetical protein
MSWNSLGHTWLSLCPLIISNYQFSLWLTCHLG